jgi:hypothetical protein
MDATDRKSAMIVKLTEEGAARLARLKERLGLHTTGVVRRAVWVCRMAHGCDSDSRQLYVRERDGSFKLFKPRAGLGTRDQSGEALTVLMCTPYERAGLVSCGRRAGDLARGLETAVNFLETVASDVYPQLYERRGSEYYPVM